MIISTLFDMTGIDDYRGKDDLPKITQLLQFCNLVARLTAVRLSPIFGGELPEEFQGAYSAIQIDSLGRLGAGFSFCRQPGTFVETYILISMTLSEEAYTLTRHGTTNNHVSKRRLQTWQYLQAQQPHSSPR